MTDLRLDSKSRICFLIPQFGMIPGYIDYFILTASYCSNLIDFHFFTDQSLKVNASVENVFVTKMKLLEFNALASQKLDHTFAIKKTYKLCDLKPMYGLIFEDYIRNYGYWGHCDFDMIFGDLDRFLNDAEFRKFDIFSVQSRYASGPFLIFKNTPVLNSFFKHSASWKSVLSQADYRGFDEAGDVIKELWKGKDIKDCKGEVQSMTHLLKDENLIQRLDLRISMKELITEWLPPDSIIHFNKGKLSLQPSGTELYIYHFMNKKNLLFFSDLLLNKSISTFQFSHYGFTTSNSLEAIIGPVLSLVKRYVIRLKRKLISM